MKWQWRIYIFFLAIWVAIRFLLLESSPPGFFADEAAGASHIYCFGKFGVNGWGESWPLFSQALNMGITTPTFLYLGTAWAKLFGYSVFSLRAFIAFVSSLSILGLYLLAKKISTKEVAFWVALVAAVSPWGFQFSRISWDPPLMVLFLVWGVYFSLLESEMKMALGAVFLGLAMYSYPPARVQVPLLIPIILYLQKKNKTLSAKSVIAMGIAGTITCIPLLALTWNGFLQARFQMLSAFSPDYMKQFGTPSFILGVQIFVQNFFKHFGFNYLFLSGDHNLRHGTRQFGILSWIDILAVFLLIPTYIMWRAEFFKQNKNIVLLGFIGLIAGIVPAAMTWESLPHSLRSIGALPFLSLITGTLLCFAVGKSKLVNNLALLTLLLFSGVYFRTYFQEYPKISNVWFDHDLATQGKALKSVSEVEGFVVRNFNYPELALRYYSNYFGGKSDCRPLR